MYALPKVLGLVSAVALLGMAGAALAGNTINGAASLDAVLATGSTPPAVFDQLCLNGAACTTAGDTQNTNETVVGDFNRDGWADIVFSALGGAGDLLCLNDGSGGFTSCSTFNAVDNTRGMAVGDLDNDGDLDLAMAVNSTGAQDDKICLNNGSGVFSCTNFNTTGSAVANSVALGDLDADGDLDVVIANGPNTTTLLGGEDSVCLNNGSAVFSCVTFDINDNSLGVALGDLDGNSALDIVIVGNNANPDKICFNPGTSLPTCTSFNVLDSSQGVALGDLEGDTDLDIVIAGSGGLGDRICTNDGSGVFGCTSFNANDPSNDVALGDLDGDSDLDIVLANNSTTVADRFCTNTAGVFACASFNAIDASFDVALGELLSAPKITGLGITGGIVAGSYVTNTTPSLPEAPFGTYSFDVQFCNQNAGAVTGLRARIAKISNGNSVRSPLALTAPEARSGGIGSEVLVSANLAGGGACTTITYAINRRDGNKFSFAIHLFGAIAGGDALPDGSGSGNDAPPLDLLLGDAIVEVPPTTPPITTPGGTAPTPVTATPVLALPPGISNLPSRR